MVFTLSLSAEVSNWNGSTVAINLGEKCTHDQSKGVASRNTTNKSKQRILKKRGSFNLFVDFNRFFLNQVK